MAPYIKYYMHTHILHTLNKALQPTMQPTTKNMEKNTNFSTSLAQATSPRLGETANGTHNKVCEFLLGRDLLA